MKNNKRELLAFALSISMLFNTAAVKIKKEPAIMPEKIQVKTMELKKSGKRNLK